MLPLDEIPPARRYPAFSTDALRRMLALPEGRGKPNEAHAARINETIAAREKRDAERG